MAWFLYKAFTAYSAVLLLHAYFDAFGAFIQTTIFTTLTMLLIAAEIPAPVDVDLNKIKEKKERKAKRVKKTQNA